MCVCVWGGGGEGDGALDAVTVCSLEGTLTQSDSATCPNVSSVRGTGGWVGAGGGGGVRRTIIRFLIEC